MNRRNRVTISSLLHPEKKNEQEQESISLKDLNDKIQKAKNDKRIDLLTKFLDENVKFDDEEYTPLSDIRKKFKEYCYKLDKNNLNNMSYNLSKEDITKYSNKYKIKYYSFCRSCDTRYRAGCCEENNRLNRSSKEIVLYMKLRNQ